MSGRAFARLKLRSKTLPHMARHTSDAIMAFLHVKIVQRVLRVNKCHHSFPHVNAFHCVRHLLLFDLSHLPTLLNLDMLSLIFIIHLKPVFSCINSINGGLSKRGVSLSYTKSSVCLWIALVISIT